jgi:arginase
MYKVLTISSSLGAPDINCGMKNGPEVLARLLGKIAINLEIPLPDKTSNGVKNIFAISKLNEDIKNKVEAILENGNYPFAIMGDCSSSIGVAYGILTQYNNLAIIWLDAHGDFNTPEISPSKCLYGMGLAHIAGYGDKRLLNLSNSYVDPKRIIMLGQRDLDIDEATFIHKLGISIDQNISDKIKDHLSKIKNSGVNDIYLHIDLDVIDKSFNPAVLSPKPGGIAPSQLLKFTHHLQNDFNIVGIGISNFIPEKDIKGDFGEFIFKLINKFRL